ncbi:unnamed protein product, partial [Nesidiocoris tenuis]
MEVPRVTWRFSTLRFRARKSGACEAFRVSGSPPGRWGAEVPDVAVFPRAQGRGAGFLGAADRDPNRRPHVLASGRALSQPPPLVRPLVTRDRSARQLPRLFLRRGFRLLFR